MRQNKGTRAVEPPQKLEASPLLAQSLPTMLLCFPEKVLASLCCGKAPVVKTKCENLGASCVLCMLAFNFITPALPRFFFFFNLLTQLPRDFRHLFPILNTHTSQKHGQRTHWTVSRSDPVFLNDT